MGIGWGTALRGGGSVTALLTTAPSWFWGLRRGSGGVNAWEREVVDSVGRGGT